MVKESASNAGNSGSIPGSGRCPGEGNGNPPQYSCLENPMNRRAWWATVYAITKSWIQLSIHTPFIQFSSVQSLTRVWLFATPWTAAHQASLSITNSRSSPKLMWIESVMPSSHLILCHPLLLLPRISPASGSFPMSQLFAWGGQSIGVSASTSVLPNSIQGWFP